MGLSSNSATPTSAWIPACAGMGGFNLIFVKSMGAGRLGGPSEGAVLLPQHQRAFLADRGREFLRDHRQQPWQRDFQAHVVIGDIDEADSALAERAEIEGEPIAAPALLMDGQQRGIVRARGGEAGPDAARRFLAT